MTTIKSPQCLTDAELLTDVKHVAMQERAATAHLIGLLAEVDSRRLYLGQGYSSLFTYCTQALHLSEHAAYGRIEAARAARKFPLNGPVGRRIAERHDRRPARLAFDS